ncbi:RluA family pseudouridine synthase [Mesonia ostreae]|uniref:RluA family pseudouridine synthase n=1 Tax=Mesonia ostreae TaxID=861110 RepID=A0ABU2KIV0_9FLAO|nr:RluA family pseudouridine synthase [Mesonia ostreae]MDT0294578.1 RluA family pseudouridine synthase [Mesonia ostreae]
MSQHTIIEKHIVPAIYEKLRLQEYASQVFELLNSRSAVKKALNKERILLNGKIASTADWIQQGQILELLEETVKPKKIFQLSFPVVFEDDFLAVIDKPSGYPTNGNYFKTIENALPFNLFASAEKDALAYPLPVHRLDNPTSGLLLIAKTKSAQAQLSLAFERKEINKTYLAIVEGKFSNEEQVMKDELDGKASETIAKAIQFYQKDGNDFSLVELNPLTGRTHQLRKHLSMHGFPIIGDQTYGAKFFLQKAIHLTAYKLLFTHPITADIHALESKLPKRFLKF